MQMTLCQTPLAVGAPDRGARAESSRVGLAWRRRFHHVLALALATLVGATSGCPRRAESTLPELELAASPDPAAERDFRAALALRDQGANREATQRFRAFVDSWPDDPLVPFAHLELGKLALDAGRLQAAKKWFDAVAGASNPVLAERGRMYRAVTAERLGQHQYALSALTPLVGRTVDPKETVLVLDSVASAQEALGDVLAALETRDRELRAELDPATRQRVQAASLRLVKALDSELLLQRAYEILPRDGFAWPEVARRLLRLSHERGDRGRVARIAEDLREEDIALDDELAALVLRAARPEDADPGVIGAILPLSGRGRAVGEAALHGLLVASRGREGGGHPLPRLVYRDDGGDPERALQALDDLVTVHRAIAVIGPLSAAPARAAAERADELEVPLLVLSPDPTLTAESEWVFRLLADPNEEMAALVQASSRRGAQRYAIIQPRSAYGDTIRSALTRALTGTGGVLTLQVAYEPGATSFVREAESVAEARPDAVVLAGTPTQIALMAPALAAQGLWSVAPGERPPDGRSALYLVPAAGFAPALAHTARRYLQGTLFAVPFDASQSPDFTSRYRSEFSTDPNLFSALAHDAYRITDAAIQSGAQTREELARALTTSRAQRTATAATGFSTTRGPDHPVQVEQLLGGTFAPAN